MSIDTKNLRQAAASVRAFLKPEYGREIAAAADHIDVQAAEIAALRQPWKRIETAPKDGKTILIGYFNSLGNWRTLRGQWMSEEYIAEYWDDPDGVEPGWFETSVEADDPPNCWRICEPTHWMPLPAPPAALSGESNG
ncbi:DUF551 domain-containing protein [Kerstersia similis]|uniref:DUF551 domain-containing protein n=1 Tax=Kerstersia similis TaxID=206505 RepID=UPI0039EFB535